MASRSPASLISSSLLCSWSGNVWTCVAHIITAVIGCGVLALSWSVAQLGWVAGPVAMLCFAFVTYVSAFLLSHCYRSPESGKRQRNYTYMGAVRTHLGWRL
jgi:amino acid permease